MIMLSLEGVTELRSIFSLAHSKDLKNKKSCNQKYNLIIPKIRLFVTSHCGPLFQLREENRIRALKDVE